jgi:ATP-dependent RNA helicase DDX18/HAS1
MRRVRACLGACVYVTHLVASGALTANDRRSRTRPTHWVTLSDPRKRYPSGSSLYAKNVPLANNNRRSAAPYSYSSTPVNDLDQDFGYYGEKDDDDDWMSNPVDFDNSIDESAVTSTRRPKLVKGADNSRPNSHFFSRKSLQDPIFAYQTKGGSETFAQLCQGAGIARPSKIQSLAWPILCKGSHTIVADQTGSGKTLAYLIPLLTRALEDRNAQPAGTAVPNGSPRIIVLAPTAELADQIRAVCEQMTASVSFSTLVITATGKYSTSIRDQIRMLQRQPVDVLISTPGRIATILRTRNSGLDLSALQSIVLDEVDVLLVDDTFGPQLRTVGAAAPLDRTQFVFVTATLPDTVVETVEKEFRGVQLIKGPGLHRVAPTVQERLVDVSVPSQNNRDAKLCFDVKAKQLLKALRQTRCRRTLVFCNTVESCRSVENLLKRKDRKGNVFEVRAYHNAMTPENRNENLAVFSHGIRTTQPEKVDYVLVCTDRAARGVDFESAPVDHVVLFDFPKDPAEYVRRVGRTARAGRTGTSTVFAYGWQLPIARRVMGSKLDSFTIAREERDEMDTEEIRGGVQARLHRGDGANKKHGSKHIIKGNIESGKQWK